MSGPDRPPARPARDDLTRIKGIGPKIAALLASRGVTRLAQIAAWTEEEIAEMSAALKTLENRIYWDDWVGQAAALAPQADDEDA